MLLVYIYLGKEKNIVQCTDGKVTLDNEDLLEMEVDERAPAGLFLAIQYPSEIAGVTNSDFLRSAINARREEGDEISLIRFYP